MSISTYARTDHTRSGAEDASQMSGENWYIYKEPAAPGEDGDRLFYVDSEGVTGVYVQPPPKLEVPLSEWDSELADPLDAGSLDDLLESNAEPAAPLTDSISFEEFLREAEDRAAFDAAFDDGIRLLQARDDREKAVQTRAVEDERAQLRTERAHQRRERRQESRQAIKENLRKAFNRRVGAVVLTAALTAGALLQSISPSTKAAAESKLTAQTNAIELVIDDGSSSGSEQATTTTSLPPATVPVQEIAQQVIEENAKRATTTTTTTPPAQAAKPSPKVETHSHASESIAVAGEINGTSWERVQNMYNYLRQAHNLSRKGAANFIGNILQEAGPGARPDAYNAAEDAYGFIQAQGGREAGIPLQSTNAQLDWLLDVEAPRDGGSPRLKAILSDPGASDAEIKQAIFKWIRWGDTGSRWLYASQILQTLK